VRVAALGGTQFFLVVRVSGRVIRQRHYPEEAMNRLSLQVRRFLVSEDGPTAVEYAVMLALIIVVCLTAIQAIGTRSEATFNSVANALPGGT
jgi:pilus assembly protein Flp/PilA